MFGKNNSYTNAVVLTRLFCSGYSELLDSLFSDSKPWRFKLDRNASRDLDFWNTSARDLSFIADLAEDPGKRKELEQYFRHLSGMLRGIYDQNNKGEFNPYENTEELQEWRGQRALRLNNSNRFIFDVDDDNHVVNVHSMFGHYGDDQEAYAKSRPSDKKAQLQLHILRRHRDWPTPKVDAEFVPVEPRRQRYFSRVLRNRRLRGYRY